MLAYQDAVSELVLLFTLVALVAGRAPLHSFFKHMRLEFRSSDSYVMWTLFLTVAHYLAS